MALKSLLLEVCEILVDAVDAVNGRYGVSAECVNEGVLLEPLNDLTTSSGLRGSGLLRLEEDVDVLLAGELRPSHAPSRQRLRLRCCIDSLDSQRALMSR